FMPPKKRQKLNADEIAIIKGWIDSGAKGPPVSEAGVKEVVFPKIVPKITPRNPVHALARASGSDLIAVARYGSVEMRSAKTGALVSSLKGNRGNINALAF